MTDEFLEASRIFSGRLEGEKVSIRGWLHHKRSSGGILFFFVRDGTGVIQATLRREGFDPEVFKQLEALPIESTIEVMGAVRKDSRAPGGYEIKAEEVRIKSKADEGYPITKKYHGPEFLLDHRHLWLRSEKMQVTLRVRAKLLQAAREWFKEHEYTEFHAPILTAAACEGGATLFPVEYFDQTVYLAQSWQLYAEAAIASLGKIYTIAPSFRAEKSRTRRHIMEYWHSEAEIPFCDLEGLLGVEERIITHMCRTIATDMPGALKTFGRDPEDLLKVKPPYPRITYDEVVERLREDGIEIDWGDDLTWVHEKHLTAKFDVPFFVTHYPKSVKAFYHKPDPRRPEVTLSADMLAPEGYGEIIGSGVRIADMEVLLNRIREEGLDPKDYKWYVDLRRWGAVPHAGFGLGLERTVMWMLKLKHIRDAIAFPRLMRRLYP